MQYDYFRWLGLKSYSTPFTFLTHVLFTPIYLALALFFPSPSHATNTPHEITIHQALEQAPRDITKTTGLYVLEYGEESLIGRGWLAEHAEKTIDVQYFIWTDDNIGTIAAESLLRAAERGVKVRVIVDDFLVEASDKVILALNAHPNVQIKIYNPNQTVGVGIIEKFSNILTKFRKVNQRMHDKTAIFDGVVGITGGRNMADEYFDFDGEYNFRDRDILVIGKAVGEMTNSFERFWDSRLTKKVEQLLRHKSKRLTNREITAIQKGLHDYAASAENFEPELRAALKNLPTKFPFLFKECIWTDAEFISDIPGKNEHTLSLGGGGRTTEKLVSLISNAKTSITIQSPYLIMPKAGLSLFKKKIKQGVTVKIITNSLASTDNLMAYSGYAKMRKKLLRAGIQLYEFKPNPSIHKTLLHRVDRIKKDKGKLPIFAIHAKSMVIDHETVFVGTFNLDPRSANLNTEVGILATNAALAEKVESAILEDMKSENSWHITADKLPDQGVGIGKKIKMLFYKTLPLKPIL